MIKVIVVTLFLSFFPFSSLISNGKIVVSAGYTKNSFKLVRDPILNTYLTPPPKKTHALNINAGISGEMMENGIYYGIGNIWRLAPSSMVLNAKHDFGVYSSFYLSSLLKRKILLN